MKWHSLAISVLVLASRVQGNEPGLFETKIQPLLQAQCHRCHGAGKLRGGFDVRSVDAILRGGQTGKVVTPGQPERSVLLRLVAVDGDPHMPPGKQLTSEEIADLGKWIASLKPLAAAQQSASHWAFRKVEQVAPPSVRGTTWVRTPVDAFILARLEKADMAPSPPASRAELARRLHYDLIGLPPTPADVEAVEKDTGPDWYERLVDRLLASPHYGERWGRHWLDLARYADSSGFHNDLDRPAAWRYRDYVVRSFNEDKPYAQFIREQLAGDEIDPRNPDLLAATGFCIAGPSNDDNMGAKTEKYRLDLLDDVISTTGNVFLGLTLGCARCHDHKYDPLPQEDYYRFLAIFNNTERREVPIAGGAVDLASARAVSRKSAIKGDYISYMTEASDKPRRTNLLFRGNHELVGPEVKPGVPTMLASTSPSFATSAGAGPTTGLRSSLADWLASPENPLTYRVWANRVWQHHFGRGLVATPSNFGVTGEKPTHPDLLDWLGQELIRNEGRLKPLHRVIVMSATYRQSSQTTDLQAKLDPGNLLLGRMNKRRLEAEAIRDGILAVSGKLNPSMGGPGVKPRMHPGLLTSSQRNKWPNVTREGPSHWRRSIYVYVKRQLLLMMLSLFDAPTSTQSCGRREESTVPTQALLLMNDDFVADQAGFFADRILAEAGPDPGDRIEHAFRLALSRRAGAARLAEARDFLAQRQRVYEESRQPRVEATRSALTDLCHVLFNCNEFVYVD